MLIHKMISGYGYLAVGLILFLDSLGIPLPTEASLLGAGAMIRQGKLSLPWVAGAALSGAAVGSFLSYYLGRLMGDRVLRSLIRLFRVPEHRAEEVQDWFRRHGNRAVMLARFIPFVRCLIGYPAGMMRIPLANYMIYTLLGYSGWVGVSLLLGYGGMALVQSLGLPLKQVFAVTVGAVIVWLVLRRMRRVRRRT